MAVDERIQLVGPPNRREVAQLLGEHRCALAARAAVEVVLAQASRDSQAVRRRHGHMAISSAPPANVVPSSHATDAPARATFVRRASRADPDAAS